MRRFGVMTFGALLVLSACAPQQQQQGGGGSGGNQSTEISCLPEELELLAPGTLTIGTDNPAYPPWFGGGSPKSSPWEINDPSTGEGFESAVAYAVAEEMGLTREQVTWVEVPFNQSFKPGPKDFDFFINQVSYSSKRDQAVDFSGPYYEVNQALVAVEGTPITEASAIADLAAYKLGAPVGTTSFDYIEQNIQPEQEPAVYDSLNDSVTALNNGQVDGIVVDLPTGFYLADPFVQEVKNGVIVGQFATVGEQEYFGMVFEEGSSLVECVNRALDTLREDGTLAAIQQEWLEEKTNVGEAPVLE
jgi:polar amino acid transport system substrate-binding protein